MGLLDTLRGKRPTSADAEAPRRFGYAVVGLGHIADYFLEALPDSPTCRVAAVVSSSSAKASSVAARYQVPHALTYQQFGTLRDLPEVDAVYLALPVSMHRECTERSAAAGKHVLCEKPMASTSEECRAMIAACQSAAVELSIAYRCPYTSVHQRARQLVQSGALGKNLQIESGFGFQLDPGWRTDPALAGGGSLFDVGIYPLNAARYLLGEEPTAAIDATAVCDSHGLEHSIRWTSTFPSGAIAACRSSYQEKIPDTLRITGSHGNLLLAPAFSHRERLRLRGEYTELATGRRIKVDEQTPSGAASHFRLEAEALAAVVRHGAAAMTPGEDGLADLVAMEAIYAAAGVSLVR
ncbi:MAG: Gfo/Idh/MocA family protein [Janthinobacterium lividum]